MKKIFKALIILTLILFALVFLLPNRRASQASPAELQSLPTMPHQVYGLAKVNAVFFVPEGTPVSAWCSGEKVAEELTVEYGGESWYSLDVYPDNPGTAEKDGCVSGEVIYFKIAGYDAVQTVPWVAETSTRLDLSASSVPPDPHGVAGLVRVNSAFVPEGILISAWCGGVKYAQGNTFIVAGQSQYSFAVPGDDLVTTVKEGCTEGETIVFQIGSVDAIETLPWHGGQTSTLNLSATSQPPGGYQVYGQVKVNDKLVPQGTRISAWCKSTKMIETGTDSDAYYTLVIPGDDPYTQGIEGCESGTLINFTIGNLNADQTEVWGAGVSPVRLDLSAEGMIGFNIFLPLISK